jgi:hypothetical protein
VAVAVLPSVAACSAGGGSAGRLPAADTPLASERGISEEPSDATASIFPASTPASDDLLYVSNDGNNSITVYHQDASGNTAPLHVIAGLKTKLHDPGELSEDASGNLYVASGQSILVFAHGASGDVAPIRDLSGSLTHMTGQNVPVAAMVDPSTGKLFVSIENSSFYGHMLRFPPDATGNEAPFAIDGEQLEYPKQFELASDSTGNYLISPNGPSPYPSSVDVFDQGISSFEKQFASGAKLSSGPTSILGLFPDSAATSGVYTGINGVADDPATKTYLASGTDTASTGIFRFAENTQGYGALFGPAKFTPKIVSLITSDTCAGQLALGYERSIYAVHARANYCASDAIYVYEHDSSGDAKPIRILSGSKTALESPNGIYEGK